MRDLDADIAMLAARLRIQHYIKLPDAIQLATAIHDGCYALLTYDRDFGDIESIRILGQKPHDSQMSGLHRSNTYRAFLPQIPPRMYQCV